MTSEEDRKEKVNLMTIATKERLLAELEEANEELKKALLSIGESGGTDDWHENFAFEQAHRDTELHTARVGRLIRRLRDVEIIKPRQDVSNIDIGNSVIVHFGDLEEPEALTILGEADSGTKAGWISNLSPLGDKLIGKHKGDFLSLEIDKKTISIEILEVLPGRFE